MLRSKHFWAGVLAGYLALVFLPQLNVRSIAARPKG